MNWFQQDKFWSFYSPSDADLLAIKQKENEIYQEYDAFVQNTPTTTANYKRDLDNFKIKIAKARMSSSRGNLRSLLVRLALGPGLICSAVAIKHFFF